MNAVQGVWVLLHPLPYTLNPIPCLELRDERSWI